MVKRGIGLLVVGAIGALLLVTVADNRADATAMLAWQVVELVGYLLALVGVVGGLVVLAVGLLRAD